MTGHEVLTFVAIALMAVVLAIPTGTALAGAALAPGEGSSRYVLAAAGLGQVALVVLALPVAGLLPGGSFDDLRLASLLGWVLGLLAILVLAIAALAGRTSGFAALATAVLAAALIGAGIVVDVLAAVWGLAGGIGLSTVPRLVPLVVFQLFGIAVAAATSLVTAALLVRIGRRWPPGRPAVLIAAAIAAGLLVVSVLQFVLHGVVPGVPMLPGWLILALSLAALLAAMALAAAGVFRRIVVEPGQGAPQASQMLDRRPPWT